MSPIPQGGQSAGSRERADAARNRERILAAVSEFFAEDRDASVTVDEIDARAGVGKGMVFRRSGSFEGLLEAAAAPAVGRLRDGLENGHAPLGPHGRADPGERLDAHIDALLHFVWNNRQSGKPRAAAT